MNSPRGGSADAVRAVALVGLLALGIGARVVRLVDWPPGPWIDEVYFLRAARIAAAGPFEPFSSTPMRPPEFASESGFRYYPTNLFLLGVAGVDRLAGGGMRSARLIAVVPAILLFLASVALAREATRQRPSAFLPATCLLATSVWLLTQGRWAAEVLATSAAVTLAAALALAAVRRGSLALAVAAGAALGLAPYGHATGRLALAASAVLLAAASLGKRRDLARVAAAAFAAALLVAAPLLVHWARHPERLSAHVGDLSILGRGPAGAAAALAANVRDYAALFVTGGDPIERHGDPSRPVVLAGVGAMLAAGIAVGLRRPGVERFLLFGAAVFVAGGLLARDTPAANASRISPATPFLLVLAGLGAAALLGALPAGGRPAFRGLLWAVLAVSAALDLGTFVRWASSPRAEIGFGAPERRLAERLEAERARAPAEWLVHPQGAARNIYFVDVLLGRPGDGGRHAIRVGTPGLDGSWLRRPLEDVLFAADAGEATRRGVEQLGGLLVARDEGPYGRPAWALYRIPLASAAESADAFLSAFPEVAASTGPFEAPEDGLYLFSASGPVTAALGGREVLDTARSPGATAALRLARGRHPLRFSPRVPGASLRITGPDGFVLSAQGLAAP